jgi:hypothetical protein
MTIGDAVRRNIFRGFNTTVISYGQRNSGKSHSMYGKGSSTNINPSRPTRNTLLSPTGSSICFDSTQDNLDSFISPEDGIVYRAIHDLFMAKKRHATGGEVIINATFIEIYNDRTIDLLAYKKSINSTNSSISGKGLSSIRLKSPAHARQVIQNAFKLKTKARSHTICTLQVTINPAVNRTVTSGKLSSITSTDIVSAKLTLVDLAGSEKTSTKGISLPKRSETSIINKDLLALSKCITALAEKSENVGRSVHIPFRDSKLTSILRGSLGGNCCTVMVACLLPEEENLEDSINTLRYAERTRNITNRVKKNMIKTSALTPAEAAGLRRENKMLRSQLLEVTRKYQFLRRGRRFNDCSSPCSEYDNGVEHPDNLLFSPSNSHVEDLKPVSMQSEQLESQRWRMKFEKLAKICGDAGLATTGAELNAHDEATLVSHQVEVMELKEQLRQLINGQCDDVASITSGLTMETFDLTDDQSTVSGTSMLSSLASKPNRPDAYIAMTKLMEIEDSKLETRIEEKKALLTEMERESITRASALRLKLEKEESLQERNVNELKEAQNDLKLQITTLQGEIVSLEKKKTKLEGKVEAMEEELQHKERLYADEIKDHEANLNQIDAIVEGLRNQVASFRKDKIILEKETKRIELQLRSQKLDLQDKKDQQDRFEHECKTLQSSIQSLNQEKLDLFEEVEGLQNASKVVLEFSHEQAERQKFENKVNELTKKLKTMTDDRNSLSNRIAAIQSASNKEVEKNQRLEKDASSMKDKINALETEIRKTTVSKPPILQERTNSDFGSKNKPPLPSPMQTKQRFLNSSPQKSVDDSMVSRISISNIANNQLYENDDHDTSSVLFGQTKDSSFDQNDQSVNSCFSENSSLNSEQVAVRMHAKKLLFWAGKSIARNKVNNTNVNVSTFSDGSFASSINYDKENTPRCTSSHGSIHNTQNHRGRNKCHNNHGSSIPRSTRRSRSPSPLIVRHEQGCSCSGSIFSGNAEHTDFFLPKLGMACTCGAEKAANAKTGKGNSTDTKSFLRSWQVSYLKSVGIKTAKALIHAEKHKPNDLARAMKFWRQKKRMKPARTKSCLVALQIWSKVAKSVLQSAASAKKIKQEEAAFRKASMENLNSPMFMEVGAGNKLDDSSCASVSTLGNNMSMEDSLSLMEGEFEI